MHRLHIDGVRSLARGTDSRHEVLGRRAPLPSLGALLLGGSLAACSGTDTGESPPLGTLTMPLATEINGVHYRLVSDTFALTGPVTGNLQHNGNGSIVVATLPEGDYAVELVDGWTLERDIDDSFAAVEAELVSPNPRPFQIVSGATVSVAWVFRTAGEPIPLGPPGLFQGNLAVIDSSNPADSIFGDVLATEQSHVDPLDGIASLRGSLTLGGSAASLAPLGTLAQIDGDLIVTGSAFGDLAGLEGLNTIGGVLEISGNGSLASLRGLSSLSAVDAISITDNPALPTCEAEWLIDNVTALAGGPPGSVEVSGNDDSGSCP